MEQIGIFEAATNNSLEKEGYAIIPDFIPETLGKDLSDFFYATVSESKVDAAFFTTHWSAESDYRKKVNDYVQKACLPLLPCFFSNYKCIFGYFLYKRPLAGSMVGMHQDWTLIDENKFKGYIVWIPLVDTSVQNGAFHVVSGSHLIYDRVRGSHIESRLDDDLSAKSLPVQLKANDALVIDMRLMHCSSPNLTSAGRLACGLIIVPAAAKVLHNYYDEQSNTIKTYCVSDTFLVDTFYDYKHERGDNYLLSMIENV